MEHVRGKLNLQKLWFYIQPTMIAMTILFQITSTICKVSFDFLYFLIFKYKKLIYEKSILF